MKKILLITLSIASAQLFSMEKEQIFPLEQLLPELKTEIIKQVVNAPSINEAINYLQNLRFVNKQFFDLITNNKTTLFGALNSLLKKFPGSEVGIARLLNTNLAQEWLKSVNPKASFKIIPTNDQQFNIALGYIENGDLDSLRDWLNQGHNPKYRQFNEWTLDSFAVEYGLSLPALELIGKYNPEIFNSKNIQTLLFLAQKVMYDKDATAESTEKLAPLIDFLQQKLNHLLSQEEVTKILNEITTRVNYQLGIQ